MITAKEAYQILKEKNDEPLIIEIYEAEDFYMSHVCDQEGFITVDKMTGDVGHVSNRTSLDCLKTTHGEYEIYLEDIFMDFLDYYEANKSESELANLYVEAQLYAHIKNTAYDEKHSTYKSKNDQEKIKAKWIEIEKYLYTEIRNIIDNEDIDYPPCVLENFDDPYYRIKPFMLRNGYTTAKSDKTWVIKRNQSNESNTQEFTDEQKAWIKMMKQHFDELLM